MFYQQFAVVVVVVVFGTAGYSLERLRRFWTSPGKQGRDEKLHQVPKNSEDSWPG